MKVALLDHNQCMPDVSEHLDITSDLSEADVLLYWQDIYGKMNIDIKNANEEGKRTFVFEHGVNSYRDYLNHDLTAKKILLMGQVGKEQLIEKGISEDRLVVVGSTLFDRLPERKIHDLKTILFAPIHWNGDIEENKVIAQKIREIANKWGFRVITKVMEDHDLGYYDNPIFSDRNYPDHLKVCGDVLSESDIVIGYKEGTFEAFAYSMGIPVIAVDYWEPKDMLGVRYDSLCDNLSPACAKSRLDMLEDTIIDEISHPKKREAERKEWLNYHVGFDLPGKALDRILNAIKEA